MVWWYVMPVVLHHGAARIHCVCNGSVNWHPSLRWWTVTLWGLRCTWWLKLRVMALGQDCSIPIVNKMEILQSSMKQYLLTVNQVISRLLILTLLTIINTLCPSDSIWRHRSESKLAQVMACCLTATSHYLHQCWLNINEVLWHSPEGNFTENDQYSYHWYEFENYWFKITATSIRGQWIK